MSKINIWLGLPIKNLSKLFITSHWPSHIKDCRQCSSWMLILIFIKLNDYTHTTVHLFKKQKQMETKASEAPQSPVRKIRPLQRFSLKWRSLKTVMRNCRRFPLQPLIACCLKMKKISRYVLIRSHSHKRIQRGAWATARSVLFPVALQQKPLQCLLPVVQFRCLITDIWCCMGWWGHLLSSRVLCHTAQPHMDVLDVSGHFR